jgi:pilus assembly protein CpaF
MGDVSDMSDVNDAVARPPTGDDSPWRNGRVPRAPDRPAGAAPRPEYPTGDERERGGAGEPLRGADDGTFRRLLDQVREDVGVLLDERGRLAPGPDDDTAIRALIEARIAAEQRRAAALNVPAPGDPTRLAVRLFDHLRGCGPLESLLRDPGVEEVVINGPRVFVFRHGRKALAQELYFESEAEVLELLRRLLGPLGKRLDEASPIVDAALPDGSRLHAVIPPAAVRWCHVNVRKHVLPARSLDELVALDALPAEAAAFLRACVRARVSVVVSGAGGSGKTTFIRALAGEIDSDQERLVCCEDTPELRLDEVLPDAVALQARPANAEGEGEITIRQLVRAALRMRPTRIIVGESRGPEALDVLIALNTGHEGGLTSVHANSPRQALHKLITMAAAGPERLGIPAATRMVTQTVELVCFLEEDRRTQRRYVTHVAELANQEGEVLLMNDLWTRRPAGGAGPDGPDGPPGSPGQLCWTGIVPRCLDKIRRHGVPYDLPTAPGWTDGLEAAGPAG